MTRKEDNKRRKSRKVVDLMGKIQRVSLKKPRIKYEFPVESPRGVGWGGGRGSSLDHI